MPDILDCKLWVSTPDERVRFLHWVLAVGHSAHSWLITMMYQVQVLSPLLRECLIRLHINNVQKVVSNTCPFYLFGCQATGEIISFIQVAVKQGRLRMQELYE